MTGVAIFLVASLLGGCSVAVKPTRDLSSRALEASISGSLARTYRISKPLVRCPARVPARIGSRSTCATELDGQVLTVTVTVTGGHGRASLRPTSAVVSKGEAEAELTAKLASQVKGAQVFCAGPALLVVEPGHSFGCAVYASGVQRQLTVTVANLSGVLSYKVLPYRGPRT